MPPGEVSLGKSSMYKSPVMLGLMSSEVYHTISSYEAEWIALSEAVKDIIFLL